MKKILFGSVLLIITVITACEDKDIPTYPVTEPPIEWELDWSDEFDNAGSPDEEIWSFEQGYMRNNEKQYYTRRTENCRVEDGMLVIEARKENYQGYAYTSSSIHTFNKKHVTYGKIEIRAKVPTGKGTWPAFWTIGKKYYDAEKIPWPECGEIDIMEYVGFQPNVIHANVHTKARSESSYKININEPYSGFHVYALQWFPDKLEFYLDDELYATYYNDHSGYDMWPFDDPQFLRLNLAIGGSWGGQQGIDETLFPHKYIIDYVRVYKQIESEN